MQEVYINFHSYVSPESVSATMNIIQQKIRQGAEKIILLISSPGGQVKAGLTLYNFLKNLPVDVETHNYGNVDSIAIAIFCAGKKRFSIKDGKFYMHEIGRDIPKGGRLERKHIEEIMANLERNRNAIIKIVAENSGKKDKEIDNDLERTKGLDAYEAKKYGLVHELKENLFPQGADVALVSFWPRPNQ